MKILLSSHRFAPSVGGIEEVSQTLAEDFTRAGHAVTVITETPGAPASLPYLLERNPNRLRLAALVRECDVFFHNNISLRVAWPLLLIRRPWVIAHHTWLTRPDGTVGRAERVKRWLVTRAANIVVSRALGASLPVPATVIGNAYREEVFRLYPEVERTGELVFVGRLVTDKGADLLIEALAVLAVRGVRAQLTIIGEGPERENLETLARTRGVGEQVRFTGVLREAALARELNRHRIMVVPSRWQEPFGIVALEGIACGCVIVGSAGGGLPEAIGPCGLTFPNGQVEELAAALGKLLREPDQLEALRAQAASHLAAHTRAGVAQAYLAVLQAALPRKGGTAP